MENDMSKQTLMKEIFVLIAKWDKMNDGEASLTSFGMRCCGLCNDDMWIIPPEFTLKGLRDRLIRITTQPVPTVPTLKAVTMIFRDSEKRRFRKAEIEEVRQYLAAQRLIRDS
jgi:hypothetical protein